MQNTSPNKPDRKKKLTETFQSTLSENKPDKFHLDKTLYKGIKENNVAKIIDVGKDGGAFDQLEGTYQQEIQEVLVETRKKYDHTKTESNRFEFQIGKHRKAIDILKAEELKYKGMLGSVRQDCKKVEQSEEEMASLVEARLYDHDIYKQMLQNLKHDILVIKKRNFDKDIDYHKDQFRLRTLKNDQFNKTRLSYRCKGMLQSIQKTVSEKQVERTTKMNSFYDVLNKKYQKIAKQEVRDQEIEEVMIRAMSEKLEEEKEWINICKVNIFLKKFLKNKMERIIHHNHLVEGAYHKIKTNTDITDSKDFINRFLNREKNYGLLLESIASKENVLVNIKEETAKLEDLNSKLSQQCEQLNDQHHGATYDTTGLQKQLKVLDNVCKDIEGKKELMYRWGLKFQCAFFDKKREDASQQFRREDLIQIMTESLNKIRDYTNGVLKEERNEEKIEEAFLADKPTAFNEQNGHRNCRIKTQSVYEQMGTTEERETYDDISEADYLHYNRRQTKKNDLARRFRIKTRPN